MQKLKDKDKLWLDNKSHYLVGLGVGVLLSALLLTPFNRASTENLSWGLFGVLTMIVGGVYGSMARKNK